ncbi:ComEA family DNA-binding protein [Lutibacter citreus]|uniref:ComEA family DNA-binding protein n=1 Tax=Lutibacter citreus TaxID=2138210 RepID=UPI000DBE1950|nr:helix-hairpin-helix domain-containing protein [Lutibacter citreus]
MKNIQSYFSFNKRQRNGIFFLLFIIISLQLVFWFVDFSSNKTPHISHNNLVTFNKEMDSLKQVELKKKEFKIYPFNPNYITDFKGYQLGMNVNEIDRLLNFRKTGKFINSVSDFQKVTQINDSLLTVISVFFKFPSWVNSKNKLNKKTFKSKNKESIIAKDLNDVGLEDLVKIRGVGDKTANRIIKYRTKLKGFLNNSQLYEVYYLDEDVANRVLKYFKVLNPPTIQKINVNTASFKEILSIVYIDYELTKKILNYRTEVAEIQSIDELKKIDGFPVDKYERIILYLKAE